MNSEMKAVEKDQKRALFRREGVGREVETAVPAPQVVQLARRNPEKLRVGEVRPLQQTIGNRALGRLLIQPKLQLNAVGDKYEQEADAVAKQVVQKLNAPTPPAGAGSQTAPNTQRQELPEEDMLAQRQELDDEESIMTQRVQRQTVEEDETVMAQRQAAEEDDLVMPQRLQRQELDEEEIMAQRQTEDEEPLQTSRANADLSQGGPVSPDIENRIEQARGNGQPLAHNIRLPMEQVFGTDFSNVRIHNDTKSHNLNQSLQANAFTSGIDIFFKEGRYSPNHVLGQELLAHELTHVIQQSRGLRNAALRKPAKDDRKKEKKDFEHVVALLNNFPQKDDDSFDKISLVLKSFLEIVNMPGRTAISVTELVVKIKQGKYFEVAMSLVDITGSVSVALSKLMIAMGVGFSSSLGALSPAAMISTVLGTVGRALPLASIAIHVGYGTLTIPSDHDENIWRMNYVADLPGILASRIFADRSISRHHYLIAEAKGSYNQYILSGMSPRKSLLYSRLNALKKARLDADAVWNDLLKSPNSRRAIVKKYDGNAMKYWTDLTKYLDNKNPVKPKGMAISFVNRIAG